MGSSGSGYGPVMGFCENRHELSCFMRDGEFLDKLIDC